MCALGGSALRFVFGSISFATRLCRDSPRVSPAMVYDTQERLEAEARPQHGLLREHGLLMEFLQVYQEREEILHRVTRAAGWGSSYSSQSVSCTTASADVYSTSYVSCCCGSQVKALAKHRRHMALGVAEAATCATILPYSS